MKTDGVNKVIVKISQDEQESALNTRKTLRDIQNSAIDKENLVGRSIKSKDKLSGGSVKFKRTVQVQHKAVQTGECTITAEDLMSDEPSVDYWKSLAEERKAALDKSMEENGRLQDVIESLEEENKTCKEMLSEAEHLVAVLKEMMEEGNEMSDNDEDAVES